VNTSFPEALPVEIGHLANFDARMLRNFRAAVDDWDEVCSALGAWEAEHLTRNDSSAEQQHQRWLARLLAWGRVVLKAAQEPEFPDKALTARISVRLRHLEDKLALWHGNMPIAEQDRILKAAFK
jgi:hypothetical protein